VVKTDPERVKTILHLSLQLVANLAIAFEPFLPFSSEKLRQMLNLSKMDWQQLGNMSLLAEGHQLSEPALLFEKIEDEAIDQQLARLENIKKENEEAKRLEEAKNFKAQPIKAPVSFEDWEKLDIRVGTVLECERVPKADKLLKFLIADGLENRTILSGIAQHYAPEQLVGKQICFIANFPARKIRGIESQGMILSAENFDGSLSVLTLDRETKPGCPVV
jgi:methionyl-tRNA synthetase